MNFRWNCFHLIRPECDGKHSEIQVFGDSLKINESGFRLLHFNDGKLLLFRFGDCGMRASILFISISQRENSLWQFFSRLTRCWQHKQPEKIAHVTFRLRENKIFQLCTCLSRAVVKTRLQSGV